MLVTTGSFSIYDAGPGWDRPVPGTVVAVGPATWLVVTCNPQYRHCRNEVVDVSDGARRVLPSAATAEPHYFSWPPTGVIAPDASTAAVAETGRRGGLSVHLIDLRTGATRDLNVPLGVPGSDLPLGGDSNDHSMAWSPDSRWLFVAAAAASSSPSTPGLARRKASASGSPQSTRSPSAPDPHHRRAGLRKACLADRLDRRIRQQPPQAARLA